MKCFVLTTLFWSLAYLASKVYFQAFLRYLRLCRAAALHLQSNGLRLSRKGPKSGQLKSARARPKSQLIDRLQAGTTNVTGALLFSVFVIPRRMCRKRENAQHEEQNSSVPSWGKTLTCLQRFWFRGLGKSRVEWNRSALVWALLFIAVRIETSMIEFSWVYVFWFEKAFEFWNVAIRYKQYALRQVR